MNETWCPHCGPAVPIDEDGCCDACGCDAVGDGADLAARALASTYTHTPRPRGVIALMRLTVQESFSRARHPGREWCVICGENGPLFARCATREDAERVRDRFEREFRAWLDPEPAA